MARRIRRPRRRLSGRPGVLGALLGAAAVVATLAPLPLGVGQTPPPPPAASDPWGGVPWCTDAIADAGGVCHGNP